MSQNTAIEALQDDELNDEALDRQNSSRELICSGLSSR